MDADVVVQWVKTEWTEQSRGEAGASRCNAVPVGFALPHLMPAVHEARLGEQNDFEPCGRRRATRSTGSRSPCARTTTCCPCSSRTPCTPHHGGGTGLPRSGGRGEWVRRQMNHRWQRPRDGGYNHLLTTLNLAHGSPSDAKVFPGTPTRHVDEQTYLRQPTC